VGAIRCYQHADSQSQAFQKHYHALDRKQNLFFSMLEVPTLDPDSLTPLSFPTSGPITYYLLGSLLFPKQSPLAYSHRPLAAQLQVHVCAMILATSPLP
jgi:hypothetical protein